MLALSVKNSDTTELVEEKETPATKHSRPQKWRPKNRQVVENTSEEGAGEREPTENPNREPFIVHSLGLGMDETNQKCKSRKRCRELAHILKAAAPFLF